MVMIDVDLEGDRLRIKFTTTETLLALVHDLDEPLSEVHSVQRLRDPWLAVHGWRTGLGCEGCGCWGRGGDAVTASWSRCGATRRRFGSRCAVVTTRSCW